MTDFSGGLTQVRQWNGIFKMLKKKTANLELLFP